MNKLFFSWMAGSLTLLLNISGMAQSVPFRFLGGGIFIFQNQLLNSPSIYYFPSNPHLSFNPKNPTAAIAEYSVQSNQAVSPPLVHDDALGFNTSSSGGLAWSTSTNLGHGVAPFTAIDSNGFDYLSYSYSLVLNPSTNVIYKTYQNSTYKISPQSVSGSITELAMAEKDGPNLGPQAIADTLYCAWLSADQNNNYLQYSQEVAYYPQGIYTAQGSVILSTSPYISSLSNKIEGLNFQLGPNGERYYCYAVGPTQRNISPTTGLAANTIVFEKQTAHTLSTSQFAIQGIATNGKGADANFNNTHVNDYPSMAMDKSGGLYNGRIYIAYAIKLGSQTYIRLQYSNDQGVTWTSANHNAQINIPSGRQNWHPAIAVDQGTGALYIAYYSMDQPSGFSTNTYIAISNNGGNTFTNVRLSDAPHTTGPFGLSEDPTYAGDNIGIMAIAGTATVCWPDNRSGPWGLYSSVIFNASSCKITGPDNILDQQAASGSVTYAVTTPPNSSAAGLVHPTWSVGPGLTIIGGNTQNTVQVAANANFNGTEVINCTIAGNTKTVTALTTTDANFTSPSTTYCAAPQTATSVNPLSGISGLTYTWSTDAGLSISSGQGARAVSVLGVPGDLTGNLTLTVAGYGNTVSTTQTINRVVLSDQSASFTGPALLNNSSAGTYNVPNIPGASYVWSTSAGLSITGGQGTPSVTVNAGSGASSEYINLNIGECGTAYTYSIPITTPVDNNLNWIFSRTYDENGKATSETKKFYDYSGNLLQQQSRTQSNTKILANSVLYDNLSRGTVTTLPAPINNSSFAYTPGFVNTSSGAAYNYSNFDLSKIISGPDPVGNTVAGTLGWYYSANNTLEPYVGQTAYPFTQTSYYSDGTGAVKKSAGIGEVFKMSSGHESFSVTCPVVNELDHYLSIRNQFFSSLVGAIPLSLLHNVVQTIRVDQNGRQVIQVADKSGNVLMSARADPASILTVNNTGMISYGVDQQSAIACFYLLSPGTVTITGNYQLISMASEAAITNSGTLPSGYYKIIALSGTVTYSYTSALTDISYNFYNQLGQLIANITPNGVAKLLQTGLSIYTSKEQLPFITLFEYDLRGNKTARTDPDAGRTEYIYRADGKIRFSQNALQRPSGRFSYTNYDGMARSVESGEYVPGSVTFASLKGFTVLLEETDGTGGINDGTKQSWVRMHYDVSDNSYLLSGYVQDYVDGNISWTEGSSGSKTWYSYDDEGRVTWMIKNIPGLGVKTLDYIYNMTGNLVMTDYQKGVPAERFIHNYTYDPDQRLVNVSTTTAPAVASTQQAKYYYYLHGPLKRIELGTNLQGIDYIHTVQGALKAINNSNKNADPGGDGAGNGFGADAFGEVLDYYTGDYSNSRTGVQPIKGVDVSSGILPVDSYAGTIKSMSWYSKKPASVLLNKPTAESPTAYVYNYDSKYQFTDSKWTGIDFSSTPATYTPSGINKETIGNPAGTIPAYDANGNIQNLQRTDESGALTDQFAYTYNNNTNQLAGVVNTATGAAQTYAAYSYDAKGQMVSEVTGDGVTPSKYLVYDVRGKVTAVYRDAPHTTLMAGFVYDEFGQRIQKLSYNTSGQLINVTYYVDGVIYTQSVTNAGTTYGPATAQEYQINGGGGRLGVYYPQIGTSGTYAYELSDHLGNVRAVIAQNGTTYEVRMYTDYYPYGMVINGPNGTNDYRYGYQGQNAEKDGETGWNAFELRMYDSRIARWLQYDPKGEFNSPYVAMGNNPVSNTDKDGGCTRCDAEAFAAGAGDGATPYEGSNGTWLVNYTGADGASTTKVFNPTLWENLQNVSLSVINKTVEFGKNVAVFTAGAANAIGSNNLLGAGRRDANEFGAYAGAARAGHKFGDLLTLVQSGGEYIIGGGGEVVGLTLDATGIGTVPGLALNGAGLAVWGHATVVGGTALNNLLKSEQVNDDVHGGDDGTSDVKKVSDSYLKQNGIDAHKLKEEWFGKGNNALYDIYKDNETGELIIYRKGGVGEGVRTGEYIE